MIYLMLFFADVIWGLNIIVTKLNYSYFHPVFLIFLKLFFALLTMLIILRYKNIQLKKTNIKELIINANCIHVINFLLTYYALKNVKGVMSASINTLAPLVMMIITFFYQKKITKSMIILLFFSIFGFLCTIHFQIMSLSLGHFLLIIALFFYNFGNYRLNKVNNHLLLYNTYMLLISLIEITFVAL
ncbi:MAG: EamA family transporter, partial [Faecalibacillus sp.]